MTTFFRRRWLVRHAFHAWVAHMQARAASLRGRLTADAHRRRYGLRRALLQWVVWSNRRQELRAIAGGVQRRVGATLARKAWRVWRARCGRRQFVRRVIQGAADRWRAVIEIEGDEATQALRLKVSVLMAWKRYTAARVEAARLRRLGALAVVHDRRRVQAIALAAWHRVVVCYRRARQLYGRHLQRSARLVLLVRAVLWCAVVRCGVVCSAMLCSIERMDDSFH